MQSRYTIISSQELLQRCRKGANLFLIDVREDEIYRRSHIKDAVSFPMKPSWWERWRKKSRLAKMLGSNKQRELVFY